jgi:hypothetical protein
VCVCVSVRNYVISCSIVSTVVDTALLNSVFFITYELSAILGLDSIAVREIGRLSDCMRQTGVWTFSSSVDMEC